MQFGTPSCRWKKVGEYLDVSTSSFRQRRYGRGWERRTCRGGQRAGEALRAGGECDENANAIWGGYGMITVLLIVYLGWVLVAFKVIKIKVNPVSVAVATLIGVFMLARQLWRPGRGRFGKTVARRKLGRGKYGLLDGIADCAS